ncbi:unnamed protein product [Vitrella brassicaformis CCMP3155]|uniref:Uncharacterized protein n=1 Tax=Vitrella brassicaformis (strain CCMP3155) TaxID=1169540 RepID=A0A0G4FKI8_VITBC|nr:unnamed protein product [Vitrella brassicaformis CCMP3155]|eukprot:CEM14305.1 unnamed protein product [Vitrella brassicaformis CCMP3155]
MSSSSSGFTELSHSLQGWIDATAVNQHKTVEDSMRRFSLRDLSCGGAELLRAFQLFQEYVSFDQQYVTGVASPARSYDTSTTRSWHLRGVALPFEALATSPAALVSADVALFARTLLRKFERWELLQAASLDTLRVRPPSAGAGEGDGGQPTVSPVLPFLRSLHKLVSTHTEAARIHGEVLVGTRRVDYEAVMAALESLISQSAKLTAPVAPPATVDGKSPPETLSASVAPLARKLSIELALLKSLLATEWSITRLLYDESLLLLTYAKQFLMTYEHTCTQPPARDHAAASSASASSNTTAKPPSTPTMSRRRVQPTNSEVRGVVGQTAPTQAPSTGTAAGQKIGTVDITVETSKISALGEWYREFLWHLANKFRVLFHPPLHFNPLQAVDGYEGDFKTLPPCTNALTRLAEQLLLQKTVTYAPYYDQLEGLTKAFDSLVMVGVVAPEALLPAMQRTPNHGKAHLPLSLPVDGTTPTAPTKPPKTQHDADHGPVVSMSSRHPASLHWRFLAAHMGPALNPPSRQPPPEPASQDKDAPLADTAADTSTAERLHRFCRSPLWPQLQGLLMEACMHRHSPDRVKMAPLPATALQASLSLSSAQSSLSVSTLSGLLSVGRTSTPVLQGSPSFSGRPPRSRLGTSPVITNLDTLFSDLDAEAEGESGKGDKTAAQPPRQRTTPDTTSISGLSSSTAGALASPILTPVLGGPSRRPPRSPDPERGRKSASAGQRAPPSEMDKRVARMMLEVTTSQGDPLTEAFTSVTRPALAKKQPPLFTKPLIPPQAPTTGTAQGSGLRSAFASLQPISEKSVNTTITTKTPPGSFLLHYPWRGAGDEGPGSRGADEGQGKPAAAAAAADGGCAGWGDIYRLGVVALDEESWFAAPQFLVYVERIPHQPGSEDDGKSLPKWRSTLTQVWKGLFPTKPSDAPSVTPSRPPRSPLRTVDADSEASRATRESDDADDELMKRMREIARLVSGAHLRKRQPCA